MERETSAAPGTSGGSVTLVPGKTDGEKAAAYRAEIGPLLTQLADILYRARQDGLNVGWTGFGIDQFGRSVVPNIDITKPL